MPVKYRIIKQGTPGIKGGGSYKYYARACDRKKVTLDEIADTLSHRSSLTRSDIIATIVGLVDLIPDLLMDNNTVELGELGTFSLNLKSEGADAPRTDGFRLITGSEISFRPSPRLKQSLKVVDYTKSKTSEW